jgi:hypothetical protein
VGARPLAGIIRWNFYFPLFSGAIKGPQIVEFLEMNYPTSAPRNLDALGQHAIPAWRRLRRRPTLLAAFWQQAGLFEKCQL